jgi:ATP-dependent helicase/DNAse subunit B
VGLYLLAVREVLGLRPVAGLYQPLGGDRKARGLVMRDAGVEGASRNDLVGEEDFERVLAEVREQAVEAGRELRAGRLEPRPESCHWRGDGCSYPSVCRCEGR